MQGYQSKGALSSTGINFSFSSILTHSNLSPPFWRRVYCRGLGGQWPRKIQRGGGEAPMYAIYADVRSHPCKSLKCKPHLNIHTVPDRSNLTGNALPERLGNAKRNGKGTLRERKRNAKRTQRER